jgi:teichuronic acid biosynthesis glycosyltransferase TuaG
MPLVSVITPVYNAAEFLPDTLHSVQTQTLSDWEHILVDDGSTDGSLEMVERAAGADPHVRLLRTSGRIGPGKARNEGLECARGKYAAFLDADDLWLPQKLNRCIAWMQTEGHNFIYHDYRHLSRDGKKMGEVIAGPDQLDLQSLHTRRGAGCLTVVIDLERLPDFRFPADHNDINEDFVAWLRLVRKGHVGRRLPEDLGRYRLSETSRNGSRLASAAACWRIYRNESKLPFGRALNWWTQYAWRAFWMHRRAVPQYPTDIFTDVRELAEATSPAVSRAAGV